MGTKELVISDEEFMGERKRSLWNWKMGIEKVKTNINSFSLPKKPATFGQEYEFPEEISYIDSIELGKWLFKMAAWKGYVLRLLSFAEMELSILDDSYDTFIAKKIAISNKEGKKITKDLALGQAISEDIAFRDLRIRFIEKKGEVNAIKRLVELYSMQFDAISREISRRGQEIKLIQATGVYK